MEVGIVRLEFPMDLKTISATLALLGSGLPLAVGCDRSKDEAPKPTPAADMKAADGKGEMKCAPGACGAEGKEEGGEHGDANDDMKDDPEEAP